MSEETATDKKFELTPAVSILLAGLLIAGSIVLVNMNPPQAPTTPDGALPPNVNVTPPSSGDRMMGSPDAPIVLIEYSDFQCPFCSRVYPTLERLVSESNGEVALVHRHLPLISIHPQARSAALASECVAEQLGDDAFWSFAQELYQNQNKLSEAYYAELARAQGADMEQFASCLSSEKYGAKVDAETEEAMRNGGTGTPFTVVYGNGLQVPISGALPYEQFAAVINAVKARQ